jgi:glycosyltransferase involved in cell wall biosynthesis
MTDPRILIFHPALPPYRLDLFNALAARSACRLVFQNSNLLNQAFDQSRLREQLVAEHRFLTRGFNLRSRQFRFGIGGEIRAFRPDVVISTEFSPVTVAVIAHRLLSRAPFAHVVWTDDNPASVERDRWSHALARRAVLRCADGLIVLSEAAVRLYRERYRASVPIGASPILHDEMSFGARLAASRPVARNLVHEHGLEGCRVLLFVGRLARVKRVDRLLRGFASIASSLPDCRLVIVGDGPERDDLEELSRTLGVAQRSLFVGRQEGPDLDAWYLLASVLALTSEFERYGAVVNEALLAGVPVVCSSVAGAQVLVRDGSTGAVLDASNPHSLAVALQSWLKRCSAMAPDHIGRPRPSLMHASFAEAVNAFFDLVLAARQHRAAL